MRCVKTISQLAMKVKKWGDKDSNLGSETQQIYSLPPLTAWVSPRM